MAFSFGRTADLLRLPLADTDGGPGLRRAQIAAAHSVAAHFWSQTQAALVVMPTGSGKSAVMVLSAILLRARRVLVIVPSRLLREQIVEKFKKLDPLREVGALEKGAPLPFVIERDQRVTTAADWTSLERADVVVTLPHAASPGLAGVPLPPPDLFDLILVDEAHHVPARIYRALADAFPTAKRVQFTATPFRRDRKEIQGDLVFTYDLAQARRDGIFGQLRFVPVTVEEDTQRARDEAIARAAARQLRLDREQGFEHRILVRTDSKPRAEELADVYDQITSLNIKRIHSGLSQKTVKATVADLRSGAIDGVITVDMLGEGFDLPHLKVAALHAEHRSLAVTLQFIGRFARTSTEANLGPASFFAVPSEIEPDAKGLYVPGAEWNEIVESMSREQIEEEASARDFTRSFALPQDISVDDDEDEDDAEYDQLGDEEAARLLRTVRPYFHVKAYDALDTPNLSAALRVPRSMVPLVTRVSEKHDAVIWIGREDQLTSFSTHEGWIDRQHAMFLLVHVAEHKLLFICSSERENSVYDALAESVLEKKHRRLSTAQVNRVIRGVLSPDVFSLGLKNLAGAGAMGGESYQQRTGPSTAKTVRVADAAAYGQGHVFLRGEENGELITIGFSSSSKIWSNRRDGLDQFVAWMKRLASKLRDTAPVVTGSPLDLIRASRRIDRFETPVVGADLPADAYVRLDLRVRSGDVDTRLADFDVHVIDQSETIVEFSLIAPNVMLPFRLTLDALPLIDPLDDDAAAAVIQREGRRADETLLAYLNAEPPSFYLESLARVDGDEQHDPPGRDTLEPIARQIVAISWSKLGVDVFKEKPAPGAKSIFEYVEDRLLASSASVVFLDDGAGEMADYVSIAEKDGTVTVSLYHCKAAKRDASVPNQQIASLYEVVGQAVKCRRYMDPRRLSDQLAHRRTLKGSAFRRGDISLAQRLLAAPYRPVFQVVVVQPSLSTSPSEPIARLLESADAYTRGTRELPLLFWGTAGT